MRKKAKTPRVIFSWRRALLGLGLGCGLAGQPVWATDQCPPLLPVRPQCPPPSVPQCPPSGLQSLPLPPQQATPHPTQPTPPRREGEPVPPAPTPTPGAAPLPDQALPYGQAPMQGTAAADSFAPNMLGDFFGGGTRGSTRSVIPRYVQRQERVHFFQGEGGTFFARFQPGPNPNQPPGTIFVPDPNANLHPPFRIIPLANHQPEAFDPPNPSYFIINGQATNIQNNSGGPRTADLSYVEQLGLLEFQLASPGAGANVGRGKIAENNSPFPTDRAFFRYSYFDNVALAPGQYVHRYTPGFEKTFFDGEASVEVRFPFAATVDPVRAEEEGFVNRSTEFGNLLVILKTLVHSSQTWHVALGMGVGIPTGDDVGVALADGTELVRIKNEVVHLMPYAAALYTPDERLFVQCFLQLDIGAGGHSVFVNPDLMGLRHVGSLNDATLLTMDIGAGYWLIRDSRADFLTGLAPFVELHYNAALEQTDEVSFGTFRIGDASNRFDVLNFTLGTHFEMGNSTVLTVGVATPLTGRNQREFDYEVGILLNHRFGPVSWPN